METLNKLIELKNFIDNNPNFSSTKWYKELGITYSQCIILKKNKMIINQASRMKPHWIWVAPMPNAKMANELNNRVTKYIRAFNQKARAPKTENAKSFFSVLEGIDIRISDYVSARVTSNGAVIKRGDFSLKVQDPELFSNIIKLVK